MARRGRSSLTRIELLLTIGVVGVLSTVLVPVFGHASENADVSAPVSRPASLQRIWDAQKSTAPDFDAVCSRKIPHFEVHDEDLPAAIARFCKDLGLLCGIALVPGDPERSPRLPDPPFKRLYAIFDDSYAGCIVTTLSEVDRAFEYRSDEGLITLVLNPPFHDEEDPLRTVIPEFTARNAPYPIALFGDPAWGEAVAPAPLFRAENLPEDFNVNMAAGGPAWDQYPTITCPYSNRTLLHILNDIARQLKLSWRLFDNSLLGGSGIDFVMGVELPTTPEWAALTLGPAEMAPRGQRVRVPTGEAAVAIGLRFFEDVGWEGDVNDIQLQVDWTNEVWVRLYAGDTIADAVDRATKAFPPGAPPKIFGDGNSTLHAVWGGEVG